MPRSPVVDRLFFAIRPDATATARLIRLQDRVETGHRLRGRRIPPERLHVTLHLLGDFVHLPAPLAHDAGEVAAGLAYPPFDVEFDHVTCFARPHDVPVVLLGGDALSVLKDFQMRLAEALAAADLPRAGRPNFSPHLTLFYARGASLDERVEPIGWTAREFALVRSAIGLGIHTTLGTWVLSGA